MFFEDIMMFYDLMFSFYVEYVFMYVCNYFCVFDCVIDEFIRMCLISNLIVYLYDF